MAPDQHEPGTPVDVKPRSRDVTDGIQKAPARAMLRAVGMTDDDWEKPQVGDRQRVERGHAVQHDAAQARRARQGRRARRPAGSRWSSARSPSATASAWATRACAPRSSAVRSSPTRSRRVMHAERLDGFVGLAGCDKSIPAMLMAAARLDLPSVFVYNGSIMPGNHRRHGDRHHQRVRGRRRLCRWARSPRRSSARSSARRAPARAPAAACSPPTR